MKKHNTTHEMVKVGLLGYGMAGQVFHAPLLHSIPGLEIRRIRVSQEAAIQLARSRYPEAILSTDVQDVFSDPAIELVVIATPNASHFSLAKQALEAGKHVVVDKPFTITSTEAEELIQLAKTQEKIVSVFHNRRWDSDFKTVQKVLSSGMLGNLVEMESRFDRFRNAFKQNAWREENQPGAGVLYDLGAHLLDQALCLFGMPQEITADVRAQRGGETDDHFEIRLGYTNLKVTLKAGMLVRTNTPRFTLFGDQGSFVKYGLDVQEVALKAGQKPETSTTWGIEPEELWGELNTTHEGLHVIGKVESEAGDYRTFYKNVFQAIVGEEELMVKPEQARDVIQLVELAQKSSQEKRTLTVG